MSGGKFEEFETPKTDDLQAASRRALSSDADLAQQTVLTEAPKTADKALPPLEIAQATPPPKVLFNDSTIANDLKWNTYENKLAGEDKIDPTVYATARQAHMEALSAGTYQTKEQAYLKEMQALSGLPPEQAGRLQYAAERSYANCLFKQGRVGEAMQHWESAAAKLDGYLKARSDQAETPEQKQQVENSRANNRADLEEHRRVVSAIEQNAGRPNDQADSPLLVRARQYEQAGAMAVMNGDYGVGLKSYQLAEHQYREHFRTHPTNDPREIQAREEQLKRIQDHQKQVLILMQNQQGIDMMPNY